MKNQSNKKILIIDDDPFIRKIYRERLVADGFVVDEAEDGIQGLDKIKSGNYDLILLDMVMVKMTGMDVLRSIRKNKKFANLRVVILSALGQEVDIKKALSAGADDYVVKNKTTPRELVDVLNKIINV